MASLDVINSILGHDEFSRMPSSSLSSSLSDQIEGPLHHTTQQMLDDSDLDIQPRYETAL
jgi:hypothetical protein